MDTNDEENIWADAELIHAYTRQQAIEDGILVSIDEWAREAGFRYPVAVTSAVWQLLDPSPELKDEGQDAAGRAWDMLTILRHAIRGSSGDRVAFAPLFIRCAGGKPESVPMWSSCGSGDERGPVITIMLAGED